MSLSAKLGSKILSMFGNGPGTELINTLNDSGADGSGNFTTLDVTGAAVADSVSAATVTGTTVTGTTVTGTSAVVSPVFGSAASGAAGSYRTLTRRLAAVPDNTATSIFEFAIPAGSHSAAFRVLLLATMNGDADTFESARVATGTGVIVRQAADDAVAAVSTIAGAQIATGGSGTITLAYSITTPTVGAGATTCSLQVTVVKTGTVTDHTVVAFIELINSEASGITVGTG